MMIPSRQFWSDGRTCPIRSAILNYISSLPRRIPPRARRKLLRSAVQCARYHSPRGFEIKGLDWFLPFAARCLPTSLRTRRPGVLTAKETPSPAEITIYACSTRCDRQLLACGRLTEIRFGSKQNLQIRHRKHLWRRSLLYGTDRYRGFSEAASTLARIPRKWRRRYQKFAVM